MPKYRKRRCRNCRRSFQIKRNPKQCYCNGPECQKARKNKWRSHKRRTDPTYVENQAESAKRWRAKKPNYWQQYRQRHAEYAQKNRDQQQNRQKQQRLLLKLWQEREIAKSDASPPENDLLSADYCILVGSGKMIAKSDVLMVRMVSKSKSYSDFCGKKL